MLKKIKKNILISLATAGLIYLAFTIYADYQEVAAAFRQFNWMLLPLLLLLSLANYIVRFIKWDYYLTILKIKIKKIDSFSIFMSGLIMSVTPGKMGELLKSYMLREIARVPISKSAPVVFVERITDFISLLVIALLGAYIYDYGREIVVGVSVFFLLIVVIISNRNLALWLLTKLEGIRFLKKHIESIHNAYESSYTMLRPAPLLLMTIVSLFSWFFECLGYYLILSNFGLEINLLWASFSYGFATIVGAITLLPGGLGVTEGSLTFMIINKGFPKEIAVASTFIVRAVTLWFAVFVGIASVALYQKRFGKTSFESYSNP